MVGVEGFVKLPYLLSDVAVLFTYLSLLENIFPVSAGRPRICADHDIFKHGLGAEQGQVLERPGYAERGDAMCWDLEHIMVIEVDVARLRLVQAADAIE